MDISGCTITGTPTDLGSTVLRIRADNGTYTSNIITLTFTVERQANTLTFTFEPPTSVNTVTNTFGDADITIPVTATSAEINDTWSSADTTIATVNATTGVVRIVSDGTTTITATLAQSATHQAADASYTLTINKFPPILANGPIMATTFTGIALDPATRIANEAEGADITNCSFIDTANSDTLVATLDGLRIAATTDGRACEINGTLTGTNPKTFTVRANQPATQWPTSASPTP